MPRKTTSLADVLLEAPWWVSVVVAATVYFLTKFILPAADTGNQILNMLFKAVEVPASFFSFIILLIAPFSFLNAKRKAKQLDIQSGIASIRHLHWRQFEELVAEAFRRQGYQVSEGSYGADGGIDITLRKNDELVLVQCKQWKAQKVGVNVIREMFGLLNAHHANRIIVVTSGRFTQEAISFAHNKPIELINGDALLVLIQGVQTTSNIEITKAPICPKCNAELTERTAKRGANAGKNFLGCSRFPKCRYTAPLS